METFILKEDNKIGNLVLKKGTQVYFKEAEEFSEDQIQSMVSRFAVEMLPYKYSHVKAAIKTIVEAFPEEIPEKYLSDLIWNFSQDTDTPKKDVDCVAVVFEEIMDVAGHEIEEKAGFDISGTGVYVYGNYLATNFDLSEADKEEIEDAIADINDWSVTTQYFLDRILY